MYVSEMNTNGADTWPRRACRPIKLNIHTEAAESPIVCVVDFCFGGKKKNQSTLYMYF